MSRITELQDEYKTYSYVLLEPEYLGYYTPMLYVCSCGSQHRMSLQHIRRGKKCPACQPRRRLTIKEVKQIFSVAGCELLDTVYHNALTPLKYKCSCGNESSIRLSKFKAGQRCSKCGVDKYKENLRSISTKEIKEILEQQGHRLIKWNGTNQQSIYQCKCGEIETVQINIYQYKNQRHCKRCQELLMQETITSARGCGKYSFWKKACLKEANYACVICGSSSRLEAHHLESFKREPETRYDVTYGVILCNICHKSYHSAFGVIPYFEDWNTLMEVMYEG